MTEATAKPTGLDLLREPFPSNQISKLPKPTKAQTDAVRNDFKSGIRCQLCGAWHHKDVVHLDYVGHAALTDRLLDCDPMWNWEPLALSANGLPELDRNGGMWIKLTICGQTRLGYGDAEGKSGGNAVKELIGDALRNAAMRFGAALDLWHKGDLHAHDLPEDEPKQQQRNDAPKPAATATPKYREVANGMIAAMRNAQDAMQFAAINNDQKFSADYDWLEAQSPDDAKNVLSAIQDARKRTGAEKVAA
jgi:hypothetical protein